VLRYSALGEVEFEQRFAERRAAIDGKE